MRSRLALTLVLLAAGTACRAKEDSAAATGTKRYPLRGVVTAVDPGRSEVTIAHREIPGYMAAMTMVFPAPDSEAVLGRLRPGTEVQGTLVVEKDGYRLENLSEAAPEDRQAGKLATPIVHAVTPEPNRGVDVGEEVPDFALTDQTGKIVRLSQMRGEPVAVTFVYTRCPIATACPLTTAKFSKLDAMLRKEPAGRLFVITVDPEKDTPAVLAQYARKAGADPARWKFLTGSPQDVADVASRFGVLYYPERGQVIHTQAVAVVDPRGRLATIYYGENWEPEHLLRDMKKARDS